MILWSHNTTTEKQDTKVHNLKPIPIKKRVAIISNIFRVYYYYYYYYSRLLLLLQDLVFTDILSRKKGSLFPCICNDAGACTSTALLQ